MAGYFITYEFYQMASKRAQGIVWIVSQLLAFGLSVYVAVQLGLVNDLQNGMILVGVVGLLFMAISFAMDMFLMLL